MRILAALFLLILACSPIRAGGGMKPQKSVLVLLDLSFSMEMEDSETGLTRLEAARRALKILFAREREGEEWALACFDEKGSIHILKGFTAEREEPASSLETLEPWGTSPIGEAMEDSLRYLAEEASGQRRFILLASDCIATDGGLLELPFIPLPQDVRLLILGFRLSENERLYRAIREQAERMGAGFFTSGELDALEEALDGPEQRQVLPREVSQDLPSERSRRPVSWVFLAAFLITLLLLLGSGLRWQRKRVVSSSAPSRTLIQIRTHRLEDGRDLISSFDDAPITVGYGRSVDLRLPTRERSRFRIDLRDGEAYLSSKVPILVNGVARREKKLKEGDRIGFGTYRLFFKGVRVLEPDRPPAPAQLFLRQSPAAVLFLILFILFFSISRRQESLPLEQAAQPPSSKLQAAQPPSSSAGNFSSHPVGRNPVNVIAPGEEPDFFDADIMFIHAHPDDESLDFGALMAQAARAGRRVVTVLFTDGEAGLDSYPNREVRGRYPDRELEGIALAGIRVQEAREALSILGSEAYLRLGLMNHPYNVMDDILPVAEVIQRWGGETELARRLAALIAGYRPEVVISPDSSSGAHEHFEHEAVGYLVKRTLSRMEAEGGNKVPGHLAAVDPLQRQVYGDLIGIDAMAIEPRTGLSYRSIQALALKKHATQIDASMIGLERLANFAFEYYIPYRRPMDRPIGDYFGVSVQEEAD